MDISEKIGSAFDKAKSGTIAVSLEAKKKFKEASFKSELSSLESRLNYVYTQIGREAYGRCYEALGSIDELKKFLENVADLLNQISAKKQEMEYAMEQFDLEIAAVKERAYVRPGPSLACGNCGALNDPDDLFCNRCGSRLEAASTEKKICSVCGAANDADDVFCVTCGSQLAKREGGAGRNLQPAGNDPAPGAKNEQDGSRETKCGRCGAANEPDDAFCIECGSALDGAGEAQAEDPFVCPACGFKNKEDMVFCVKCGSRFR